VLFWSAYNLVVLLLAMAACVELPRYRREERLATSERVRVSVGGDCFTAALEDISLAGARILAPAPGQDGDAVVLELDEVGEVAGRIVRGSEAGFAIEFLHAEGSRDALTRKLYSGRYYERPRDVQSHRLLRAVVARALR
jgi:cellulose synthase (UDP-forming)